MEEKKPTEVETPEPKTYSEEYVKELRGEAKQRRIENEQLAERLRKIEEEEALKQGKFKEVADLKTKEAEELKAKLSELEPYKEKYTAVEKQQREELLAKLDEDERENWKEVPLDLLRTHVKSVEKYKAVPPGHNAGRSTGKAVEVGNKTWDDLSSAELEELSKSHPVVYNQLKRNKFKG